METNTVVKAEKKPDAGDHAKPAAAPQAPKAPAQAHAEHAGEEIPTDLHKPHWLVVAVVVLLFCGVMVALYYIGLGPHEREHELAKNDAAELASQVPAVNVSAPRRDVAGHTLILPCDIRPNQETMIYTRTSGYLKKFYKDIGDHVDANELLAEIDAPEVDAQLEQAKAAVLQANADVAKAQADLDLAQRTLDRYQDIQGNGVAQQERDEKASARDQAIAALAQTKANVKASSANVDRLKVLKSFDQITAPFDGIITERNYDVGALLSGGSSTTGRELFRLTQSTTLRVFINVPQVEASQVSLNSEAKLSVRNFPAREFTGTVARLAGALDPNARTMAFELHFPNPKGELYPGMYGQIRLEISQSNPVLLVPTSALIFNAAGVQVAIVRDNKVHFAPVSVGDDRGTELEITSGLSPDDRVITNPGERLGEGSPVQAVGPAVVPPTPTAAR